MPISDLRQLTSGFPRSGRVTSVFLRPSRVDAAIRVDSAEAIADRGLLGDRATLKPVGAEGGGKRQVTLLQAEHLPLIAAWLEIGEIDAAVLRRNIVVSGLNLVATKSLFVDRPILLRIGADAVFQVTGPCEPCSKMESRLGPGAYNAMRGHGGMTARVIRGGVIGVGDTVRIELASIA